MKPSVRFGRIYEFSAAHRLHSKQLSDKENETLYAKCNNFYGHGHDYKIEVVITGRIDKTTGMIIPLPKMDAVVKGLLNELDHKHFNYEIDFFKENIPTGEVIIKWLWDELDKRFEENMLTYLKLWETKNNYFEIDRSKIK
jgi:6-pyruvoyltetrahydropterin/6-carboxytetrahydropterin synthase